MNRSTAALVLFVAGVVAGGWAIGYLTAPGAWYAALAKPAFNPPNWLFAPAWTVLYVLMGIAGWRVWTKTDDIGLRVLWVGQLALNFAWSPAFFGLEAITPGLFVIVALLAVIVLFVGRARHREPVAALLFLPYLGWVAFATLLNAAIWWLNP